MPTYSADRRNTRGGGEKRLTMNETYYRRATSTGAHDNRQASRRREEYRPCARSCGTNEGTGDEAETERESVRLNHNASKIKSNPNHKTPKLKRDAKRKKENPKPAQTNKNKTNPKSETSKPTEHEKAQNQPQLNAKSRNQPKTINETTKLQNYVRPEPESSTNKSETDQEQTCVSSIRAN